MNEPMTPNHSFCDVGTTQIVKQQNAGFASAPVRRLQSSVVGWFCV